MVASAAKTGDETLVGVSAVGDCEGLGSLGLGVEDSVAEGSTVGVLVAGGVEALIIESGELLHPKKLERMNAVPTTPTIRFVLLSDFKLHCLDDAI